MIHTHELKFPEVDAFSKQFNICSELYKNIDDEEVYKQWLIERWRLETGSY